MTDQTTLDLGRAAAYVLAATDAVRRVLACDRDRVIQLPADFRPAAPGKPSGCINQARPNCLVPDPAPGSRVTLGELAETLVRAVRVAEALEKGLGGGGVTGEDVAAIGPILAPPPR